MTEAPSPEYARFARGWGAALALALGLFAARMVYLAWLCPYTLIEDEAQYWEWSRRLEWSYYSKGPGIALAIRAATSVFGTSEWAVRLPAALSLLVASLAGAALAKDIFRDARSPFMAVAAINLVPVMQAVGLLMTIDMPYAACWIVSAWAFWRAVRRGSGPALCAAGLALGVGFLFKYTALMLLPGMIPFAIASRRHGLKLPRARWWVAAAGLTMLGLAPVIVWNAQHEWMTVKHLMGHLGMRGGDRPVFAGGEPKPYSPLWTLEYLGAQAVLAGPVLTLGLMEFFSARRRRAEDGARYAGSLFLLCCAAPVWVMYLLLTLVAPAQQNWPMAAYTTIAVLASGAVTRGMDDFRARLAAWRALPEPRPRAGVLLRRPETAVQVLWHMAIGVGLVVGLGFAAASLIARVPGIGPVVPLHRLMFARERAAEVESLIARLRREGAGEPFVLSHHYGVAAQSAFYLPGRPITYCSSAYDGGRRTQYDLFPDTDLDRATPALLGRPAVMLGGVEHAWGEAFERVVLIGKLAHDKKDDRPAFLGYNFRGFPHGKTAP